MTVRDGSAKHPGHRLTGKSKPSGNTVAGYSMKKVREVYETTGVTPGEQEIRRKQARRLRTGAKQLRKAAGIK